VLARQVPSAFPTPSFSFVWTKLDIHFVLQKLLNKLANRAKSMTVSTAHPNGHFYSPVTNPRDLSERMAELYPVDPIALGVVFDDALHKRMLVDVLKPMLTAYDYPEHGADDAELSYFYTRNSQFSWLDARALFSLLRAWQPARIVEVGSGYSSLLMCDVNRRFLAGRTKIECVEPYPRAFLRRTDLGLNLIEKRVQDIPLAFFESLAPNDLLFIDSSHVAKTGSDVNYLYLQVLPLLKPGVRIHIHDIFLPADYPKEWVIDENRSWNEQYVVHAMLMGSNMFKIVFGNYYAFLKFPQLVIEAINHPKGHGFGGGSLYIERI
jgi:predicted O-methyltransferase YrrM